MRYCGSLGVCLLFAMFLGLAGCGGSASVDSGADAQSTPVPEGVDAAVNVPDPDDPDRPSSRGALRE